MKTVNTMLFCCQVTAVPTVLGIKDGKIVDRFTGLANNEQLDDLVAKLTDGQ